MYKTYCKELVMLTPKCNNRLRYTNALKNEKLYQDPKRLETNSGNKNEIVAILVYLFDIFYYPLEFGLRKTII